MSFNYQNLALVQYYKTFLLVLYTKLTNTSSLVECLSGTLESYLTIRVKQLLLSLSLAHKY
jgi:hypothetical protein